MASATVADVITRLATELKAIPGGYDPVHYDSATLGEWFESLDANPDRLLWLLRLCTGADAGLVEELRADAWVVLSM